jgi:hypothetical protein
MAKFTVLKLPHIGLHLKIGITYDEADLRNKCDFSTEKLEKLKLRLVDPAYFERVEDGRPLKRNKVAGKVEAVVSAMRRVKGKSIEATTVSNKLNGEDSEKTMEPAALDT